MSQKFTLFIMSASGAPVRQYVVSKRFVAALAFLGLGCLAAAGYGVFDYCHLRKARHNSRELEKHLAGQTEVVTVQHKQIQQFASDINSLKETLLRLAGFEKQIRVIANLEPSNTRNGLFGVGGSAPKDLNPKLDLAEKHAGLVREMHEQMAEIRQASVVQEMNFESLIKGLDAQKTLLASTPAIWPAQGLVTSAFGSRISPFTGLSEFHSGLDIASEKGTPVIATANGKVAFTGDKGAHGKVMIIDHGHGAVTWFAHLDQFLKQPGDAVKRGEKIALIGNSGRTTGPHLHYEVHLNGVPVNPERYILN